MAPGTAGDEIERLEDDVRRAVAVRRRQLGRSCASMHSKVDVEIQRTAEALDQGDRAGLGRLTGEPGLLDQVRGDAAVDDAEHPAHDRGAAGEQETQRIRDAQHPLAHRLLGKDLVDQQRGALGHAPGATAGAETARLAAERDQVLGMAGVAAHPQEAVLETPALEVVLELLLRHTPASPCPAPPGAP